MNIETTYIEREFLGIPIELRVKYVHHKPRGKRMDEPSSPETVEIMSITTQGFSPAWTVNKQWIEVEASDIEAESISDEILEGL